MDVCARGTATAVPFVITERFQPLPNPVSQYTYASCTPVVLYPTFRQHAGAARVLHAFVCTYTCSQVHTHAHSSLSFCALMTVRMLCLDSFSRRSRSSPRLPSLCLALIGVVMASRRRALPDGRTSYQLIRTLWYQPPAAYLVPCHQHCSQGIPKTKNKKTIMDQWPGSRDELPSPRAFRLHAQRTTDAILDFSRLCWDQIRVPLNHQVRLPSNTYHNCQSPE